MKPPNDPIPSAELRCEAILAAMGDAVTVQDRNFRVMYQNPAMKELYGNCIGSICHSVYEKHAAVCPDCPVAACFADGSVHTAERVIHVNGEPRTVENTASPLRDEQGDIYAAVEVLRDITSRKKTEDRLTRYMNMYAALSQTNKAIMESASRGEMFDRVCSAAVEFGKFSLAVIGLTDPEGVIRSAAHSGAASRYLEHLVVLADAREEKGRGPTGKAISEGVPYICNDFHNDPITTPWRIAARKHGIRASAAFPLRLQGRVVGAMKVYSDHAGFFDEEVVDLMTEMSANISFCLESILREEERRETLEALRSNEEQLRYASTHDQLTGLYNRAYFDAEFARIKSGRSYPVSVVISDVDGLKLVNDSFGHAAGDRLLQMAAKAMKDSFRAEDVVARIGGDEFGVILPNADTSIVHAAMKRILAFKPDEPEDNYCLSISVGCATADCAEQLGDALKQADASMYFHKFRRKSRQLGLLTDEGI